MGGAGLEVRSVASTHENPPLLTDFATFIGHDGVTYGFWSNQGFFPQLNASIALMTNQDHDGFINYQMTCHIVKIVAQHLGISDTGLTCAQPQAAKYICA